MLWSTSAENKQERGSVSYHHLVQGERRKGDEQSGLGFEPETRMLPSGSSVADEWYSRSMLDTPALDHLEPDGLLGSKYHDWWLGWSAYDRPMAPVHPNKPTKTWSGDRASKSVSKKRKRGKRTRLVTVAGRSECSTVAHPQSAVREHDELAHRPSGIE